jgi:GNAT superfamily N-acetyltransferase
MRPDNMCGTPGPPGPYRIRPMKLGEVEDVSRVIVAAIRSGFARSYSAQVVEATVGGNSPEAVLARAAKQIDHVLTGDGRIIAMIGLKRNEIGHLFVEPAHSGKGIGRRLVEFARGEFGTAGHLEMLTLASLNAVGFYEQCGFHAESRGSFSLGKGLDLEYVKMRAAVARSGEKDDEARR